MAKGKGEDEPILRASSFRQIFADHFFLGFDEDEDIVRLTVGSTVVSGSHDQPGGAVYAESELILTPKSARLLRKALSDWEAKTKPKASRG